MLVRAYLAMETRGGPRGVVGAKVRLVRSAFPLLLLALGFFLAAPVVVREMSPLLWMAVLQVAVWALLAYPMTLAVEKLLDRSDLEVLGHLPVSSRVFLAVRMTRVLAELSPATIALIVGPLMLGCFRYPVVGVLIGVPLTSFLSLITMVGAFTAGHALLLWTLGNDRLKRLRTAAEVSLLACVMGGGALLVGLAGPTLLTSAVEALASPGPAQFFLPPLQLGGLFAVLCGEASVHAVELAGAGLVTPLVATLIALVLVPRARCPQRPPREVAHPATPRARNRFQVGLPWSSAPQPVRAGQALAAILARRDPVVLRRYWPPVLGALAVLVLSVYRLAPTLGESRHWLVLVFWFACTFPWTAYDSIRTCSHPEAVWLVRSVPFAAQECFLTGTVRGAWWSMALPTALALLVLAPVALGSVRVGVDVPFLVLSAFLLAAWALQRRPQVLPFSREVLPVRKMSSSARLGQDPARRGMSPRLLALLFPATHALLHSFPWLVAVGDIPLLLFFHRAWGRLTQLELEPAAKP